MTKEKNFILLVAYRVLLEEAGEQGTQRMPLCFRLDGDAQSPAKYVLRFKEGDEAILLNTADFIGKSPQEQAFAMSTQRRMDNLSRLAILAAPNPAEIRAPGTGVAGMVETAGAFPGAFGYKDRLEAGIKTGGLAYIGSAAVAGLDEQFKDALSHSDHWRVAAELVIEGAALEGKITTEQVPGALASALLEEAEMPFARMRAEFGEALCQAANALSVAPAHESAPHVFRYYLEAPSPEILERRLQAARTYPAYAGLIGNIGRIGHAVDAGEPIVDPLLVAMQSQERKKVFRKIQGEVNPIARHLFETGGLDAVPVDWIPQGPSEWEALRDLEAAWRIAVPGDAHTKPILWAQELFAGSKGKFREFTQRVAKEAADRRAPDGTGEEAAAHFKANLNIKPIDTNSNVVREIITRTNEAYSKVTDEQAAAAGWPPEAAVGAWLRKSCVSYGDLPDMQKVGETIHQLVDAFATRIVLPIAMMAEKAIAMPTSASLLSEARRGAAKILFSDKNAVAIAALGRNFMGHYAELTQPLLTETEAKLLREKEARTAAWRRVSEDRQTMRWMEFFKIGGDTEDYPPLTAIQEFAPGYMAVPLFNRQQLMEEGNWGNSGLDRCGVDEMHNCIGPYHANEYIMSGGISQVISIRRIEGNSYVRCISAAVRLHLHEGKPQLRIIEAKAPRNQFLSPEQSQQLDAFLFKLTAERLINPRLLEKVKELKANDETLKENQVAIEKLIGYSPFPVFKTISALKTWQGIGILPASWRDLKVDIAGETQEMKAVRQYIREVISLRTGMSLQRAPGLAIPAFDEKAKPAVIEIKPNQRGRVRGLFTSPDDGPEFG